MIERFPYQSKDGTIYDYKRWTDGKYCITVNKKEAFVVDKIDFKYLNKIIK